VLACGIRNDTGAAFQLHAIDQAAVLRPVTKAVYSLNSADELYAVVRRAFHEAVSGTPGPVAVTIPANLMMLTQEVESPTWVAPPGGDGAAPEPEMIEEAARRLTMARQVAIYVGRGAEGAAAEIVRLAETLGAPVCSTFQGKGVFPENHPLWLWTGFGAQAPRFVRQLMDECDLLLAIGCRFSEVATGSYGMTPPEELIHVDVNPDVIGKNYPAKLAIQSDAALFVRALLELLQGARPWGQLAESITHGHATVQARWNNEPSQPGVVNPKPFFDALQRHCREDTVYSTDSGNGTFLAAEHLRLDAPGRFIAPVDFSCMGYSVPAAVGAAMANPGRDVVAIPGDGAFLMTGLELLTGAAYRAAPLVCVLRDHKLGQIAQFQKVPLNRETCSVLPKYSVAEFAGVIGARFFRVVHRNELDTVLPAALESTREGHPAVVEVVLNVSRPTYFTRGVLKTNFWRLSWGDRIRMLFRALARRF